MLVDPPVPPIVTSPLGPLRCALDSRLTPRASLTLVGSFDSAISLGKQGTLKMKNPAVISAHAQKSRGPIKYILSASWEKEIVWARRKQAAIQALKQRLANPFKPKDVRDCTYTRPTAKMTDTPSFRFRFICKVQIIRCGSRTMAISVAT